MKNKCPWCVGHPLMEEYHDNEWGTPVHDDNLLFEHLLLDTFQAGLSWRTILVKRENFRLAFSNFSAEKIVLYNNNKIEELLMDTGIIRNRLKIKSAIGNAKGFLEIQKKYGSFDKFIWQFTGGKTIINRFEKPEMVPASTLESDAMSKALKKLGFKFVGTTICYAFMQATGMVNDHLIDCFRYTELNP